MLSQISLSGRGTAVLQDAFAMILYSSSTTPATILVPPKSIPSLYIIKTLL